MSTYYIDWLRGKVGQRKVFLPFASIIVHDSDKRILLQKRTDFDVWGLPGGVLELDEDLNTCARRELKEETGLEAGPLHLVGVYTDPEYDVLYPNGDQVQQFTVCFKAALNGGTFQPDGVETSEEAFFTLQEIGYLNLPHWYRDMINDSATNKLPAFEPARRLGETTDQIAAVRQYIGTMLYSGIGASAIIEDEKGRILMLQHRNEKGWRPPAGFSDLGENVAHTAVREVLEETGLLVHPERIIGIHSTPRLNITYSNGDQIRTVGVVFKCKLLGGAVNLDNREILDLAWMTPDKALEKYDETRRWFFEKVLQYIPTGYFVC